MCFYCFFCKKDITKCICVIVVFVSTSPGLPYMQRSTRDRTSKLHLSAFLFSFLFSHTLRRYTSVHNNVHFFSWTQQCSHGICSNQNFLLKSMLPFPFSVLLADIFFLMKFEVLPLDLTHQQASHMVHHFENSSATTQ